MVSEMLTWRTTPMGASKDTAPPEPLAATLVTKTLAVMASEGMFSMASAPPFPEPACPSPRHNQERAEHCFDPRRRWSQPRLLLRAGQKALPAFPMEGLPTGRKVAKYMKKFLQNGRMAQRSTSNLGRSLAKFPIHFWGGGVYPGICKVAGIKGDRRLIDGHRRAQADRPPVVACNTALRTVLGWGCGWEMYLFLVVFGEGGGATVPTVTTS
jgi:hypothetical protein